MAPQEPPLDPPLLNYVGGLHMIVPLIVLLGGFPCFRMVHPRMYQSSCRLIKLIPLLAICTFRIYGKLALYFLSIRKAFRDTAWAHARCI